ncbi:cytochrome P450 [Streptomyces sp. NPDC047097]|uniref:cytochrome P450 n=1 Tax=Streptomyces sp. NPDC047097 TaxID=3155260 RepID=UPI0033D521C1
MPTESAPEDPDALLARALSSEVLEDPYPHYARLLATAPVHLAGNGACHISGHAPCERVLADPRVGAWGSRQLDRIREDWRVHPACTTMYSGMLTQDPPLHTELRRPVSRAFTPRRVERLREAVDTAVHRYLDALADSGADGTAVDFMETFAFHVPALVIGDLLGVPRSDHLLLRDLVREWKLVFESAPSGEHLARADAAAVRLWAYLGDLVAERRARPRDDLVSALLGADAGDRLSAADLLNTLASLYAAGLDTVSDLFGNGLVALLKEPEQADVVRTDPGAARTVTDELLRYDPPGQMLTRLAREDLRVDGLDVAAGTPLVLLIGAANRDPGVFAHPESLDVRRAPNPHLSLGHGAHHCLGASLSRLEGGIGFPALLKRFPRIGLAGPPTRRSGAVFRGYERVPVTL